VTAPPATAQLTGLLEAGHGRQVVLSGTVVDLLDDASDVPRSR
jgi:hypothetical protein